MVKKTVGSVLKERRTQLDWSLDVAEKNTNIKKIYISALETDNHNVLPGKFYVRAYLKQYSEKLELDTDALLTAFDKGEMVDVEGSLEDTGNYRFVRPDERIPDRPSEFDDEKNAEEETRGSKARRYLPIIALSAVAVVILGFVIAIVFLNQPKTSDISLTDYTVSSKSSSKSDSSSKQSTSLSTIQNGPVMTVTVTSDENPVVLDFALDKGAARTAISLTNSNASALMLSSDNDKATATINANATQSTITLGLANTMSIKINGQALMSTQPRQNITTIILKIVYSNLENNSSSGMSSSSSLLNENE